MPETYAPWDAADYIETAEDVRMYLDACMDEDPGDGRVIRAGLKSIARSKGIAALSRETGLNRGNLYQALSEDGNPAFGTVLKVIRALGLKLRVEAV